MRWKILVRASDVDESVPSQQGLKLYCIGEGYRVPRPWSMSPFHHNKD